MRRTIQLSGVDIVRVMREAKDERPRSLVRKLSDAVRGLWRPKVMTENETPQAGKHGIKDLDEFLDGFFEGGAFVAERLADGTVDIGDAFALGKKLLDKDFRHTMTEAGKGIENIPKEIADLKEVELDYLVEKFKTDWLPTALASYAQVAAANQAEKKGAD